MTSGKLDYGLHDPIFALAQQREGRLRVLAVSTAKRLQSQPDLPTMTESGVPMDLTLWWGVMVPAATPRPIIDKINQWFSQIVSTEETKKFLNDVRRRPDDQHPGTRPGNVRDRDQGMGRIRPDGQDRAAMTAGAANCCRTRVHAATSCCKSELLHERRSRTVDVC